MDQQPKEEWMEITTDYHKKQFGIPYRSTVLFCEWLEEKGLLNAHDHKKIVDIGAGQGANLNYMAKKFPASGFKGIDLNACLVDQGNRYFQDHHLTNCRLLQGDLYQLDQAHIGLYDGVVSYQTLSWLPEYQTPLRKMMELDADWIALTSLFFDGDVDCTITVKDYTQSIGGENYRQSYYNIYSLNRVKEFFKENGYTKFSSIPFEIDIDLPKSEKTGMGSYTEKLTDGRRLQISGPVLMSWYFLCAQK
ncbi:class I SAM-dependent methyltransferase [Brevibacillus sp. NRS-1366]|uniref:class I SAM-dependent methyltransferase n=1 Tax=Brevibacillus sp. NRS-1366 TaxID=3233899 RepID=UPI003D248FF2